jgi:hypothetical protein
LRDLQSAFSYAPRPSIPDTNENTVRRLIDCLVSSVLGLYVLGKGRGKHGRMVTLRLTSPTLSAMREYLKARQHPGATALFGSHAKTRPKARGQPISPHSAWRIVWQVALDAGLPHIRPHDFRQWMATQMLRQGVPIDQVQRFLNHRSIRTTQLCAKTAEREVDEAGARTSPLAEGGSVRPELAGPGPFRSPGQTLRISSAVAV